VPAVLWRTHGECDNYGVLTGHKAAILDLQWSRDSRAVFSASADATICSWDIESGQRIRRHIGHEEIVNCLDVSKRGPELLVSGGDDGNIGIWDTRQKWAADYIETEYPITAIALAEAGNEIYTGGIGMTAFRIRDAESLHSLQTTTSRCGTQGKRRHMHIQCLAITIRSRHYRSPLTHKHSSQTRTMARFVHGTFDLLLPQTGKYDFTMVLQLAWSVISFELHGIQMVRRLRLAVATAR
jgi:WD40 repeat protein